MNDAFFKGINWEDVYKRKLPVPLPILKPVVGDWNMARNFGEGANMECSRIEGWSFAQVQ